MGKIDRRALGALSLAVAVLTSLSLGGCLDGDDADTGTVGVNLVGQGASGATYRLRDATITVAGPSSTIVWNTEDDPDRTSLSANVVVGNYTATLAPGWRLERLVMGQPPVDVTATLVSPNPVAFTVNPQQRTVVPLQFAVEGGVVDMSQGYDIVIDIDEVTPSIITMPATLTVNEGSTAAVAVRLSSAPAAPVVVSVTSSNGGVVNTSPVMLVFTPASFANPQIVNIAALQDPDSNNEMVVLTLAAAGLPTANVTVLVLDDDTAMQAIIVTAPNLTVVEGGSVSFGVRLAAPPPGPIPVQITSSNPGAAAVTPTALTFTPASYNVFQAVVVSGVQDPDFADATATLTLVAPGAPPTTIAVVVIDDE